MELLKIGIRNVRRNFRRTVLNVVALAVGTAMMIVLLGWVRGYFTSFYNGIIRFDTGHLQVLHEGYLEEQRRMPLDLRLDDYRAVAQQLRSVEGVEAVAPRIRFSAQVGNGVQSARLMVRAIEPSREAEVTVLPEYIVDGRYLDQAGGALIGASLAEKLDVAPGELLFISAVDADGVENMIDISLRGTFELGYPALDNGMVYMDLDSAASLLSMHDAVTHLVVGLDGGPDVSSPVAAINRQLPEQLQAYSWREFAQVVVSAVQADAGGFAIILVIIYILVIVGILNSMSMTVQERTREIGTLRAIGMRRGRLSQLFLSEAATIAVLAGVVGSVLAGAIALYLELVGIDLSALAHSDLPLPFGEKFSGDFRGMDFVIGSAITLVTAVMGSAIPTRRAAHTPIAEALGSHLE